MQLFFNAWRSLMHGALLSKKLFGKKIWLVQEHITKKQPNELWRHGTHSPRGEFVEGSRHK
eukprot:1581346-Prorocentrum_lima.AAC.1